ncbi:membralin-like protein At1g60995 [Typha latifolia]|uniref:membralin-like protein At1g60995 n=1 Tax=Typha latifolia TaxID=4733 RepID=UPI003C2EB5AD
MDQEEMSLRVRARLSGMLSQLLAPKLTMALEYACLAVAVALLCFLVVLHTNFVQQPRCSGELSGINITGAQLVQIKICGAGAWTEDTTRQEMNFQNKSSSTESSIISDMNGFFMILKYLLKENTAWKVIVDTPKFLQMLQAENLKAIIVQWLDKRREASEATYLYTAEKGYLLLSEGEKSRQNIITVNATLFCFGNRWQQVLINTFVGYDTILMNSLLSSHGHGHLYNSQTKELYDLTRGEGSEGSTRFGDYFVRKSGVLIMSLFIFFTTTMPVSFILRETESRTLKLTAVQLHHHDHFHLPAFQLIFVHVTESLSFVPIMIGILFFLSKLYNSELLAFLVLILVWLSEVFTLISARTSISMQFFPQFFLLYFLIFHIYFLSFPYGFSYLAFSATVAFVLHLILYFWNHFEVPILSRAQLPQQDGAQLASPMHSTSAVQNASISMLNSEMDDYEVPTSFEIPLRSDLAVPDTLEPIEVREAQEHSDSSTQQTEAAPEYSLSNPSGSLFCWLLLRGAFSSGTSGFFSMFRNL